MKKLLLFLSFLSLIFIINPIAAQQDSRIAVGASSLKFVERVTMPAQDNDALMKHELDNRAPGIPPHYAVNLEVNINPQNHGVWESLPNGKSLWRLRIYSAGAKSLNLGFTKYFMPEGASLILYSSDKLHAIGPFTPADNEIHEQLWSPILSGEEIVLEVQIPEEKIPELQLDLRYVNHDYLGFGNMIEELKSGSCNVDVICGLADGYPEIDAHRDIIQSVAVIGLNGGTFCTGFLVNNTRQDCTPFFMTAFHCGIDANNAPTFVAYWNYDNSTCRAPGSAASGGAGDGLLTDFNTGAIYKAGNAATDFTLIQLDDPVSETANAYYAGWTATGDQPQSAVCIHHPSTDEKRITFDYDPIESGSWSGGEINHWYPDWDLGVTEGGSSGSPLFDENERVIGQLHGGPSSCTSSDVHDLYGMFHLSWNNGPSPNTRLKDWLDPDNTGALILDGRWASQCSFFVEALNPNTSICSGPNAVIPIIVSPAFSGPVDVIVSTVIGGFPYSISINDVAPGDTTDWIVTNTALIPPGAYNIAISGSDGTNTASSTMIVNVSNAAPGAPTLIYPVANATAQPLTIAFDWADNGTTYALQVATDAAFTNIVAYGVNITESTYEYNFDPQTTYFWRVRSTNPCGTGPWSSGSQFTTSDVVCNTYASTDVPVAISNIGQVTVTSELNVPGEGIISDVNVLDIFGLHTWLGDLNFSITSPSGTSVVLLGDICGDVDNFNISFDDEATGTIPCPYNDGNTYPPTGSLADFIGEPATGTWVLTVFDDADVDGGSLEGWSLELCVTGLANMTIEIEQTEAGVCQGQSVTVPVSIGADFVGDVALSLNGLPAGANAAFDPNPAAPGTVSNLVITTDNTTPGGLSLIQVAATDGINNSSDSFTLAVTLPLQNITLLTPADDATDQSLTTTLTWAADPNAVYYEYEIATDSLFNNIVGSNQGLTTTSTAIDLTGGTTYFWRVMGGNFCGNGDWSTTFSFTTAFIFCNEYHSTEVPLAISDGPPVITIVSTLNIPAGGNILDLNVIDLTGVHSYLGDIRISLTSPSGTTAILVDRICGTEENFDIEFDDEASAAPPCPYNDGNAYLSDEALSVFDGELSAGTWTLTLVDEANDDGGFLNSWGLLICMTDYDDYSLIPDPATLTICGNSSASTSILIGADFDPQGVNLALLNVPAGLNADLSTSVGQAGESVVLNIENMAAANGAYNITVNANDGTQNTEINIPIQVIFLPSNLSITAPANNAVGIGLYPTLTWSTIPGVNAYHVVVATDPAFLNILYDQTVTGGSFPITTALDNGTVYYWMVDIQTACGNVNSGVNQFTTLADLVLSADPQNISLCEGENGVFILTVGNGFGADGAQMTANNPAGTTVNYSQNPIPNGSNAVVSVVGLSAGVTNITFTASGPNGSNNISVSYTVDNGPASVTLQSPPNSATGISLSPNFVWNSVSEATSYEFILASDAALNNIVFQGTLTGTAFSYSGPLESGTTYYWTVIAHNDCSGTMSAVYQFNTQTVGTSDIPGQPIEIFPNPAQEWVEMRFGTGLNEATQLEWCSVNGQILTNIVLEKGIASYRLPLATTPSGVYLLKLIQGNVVGVNRVVVQK